MSNNSVIEHRACYHFIKVEEDYIAICCNGKRSPHCKALILAILEGWTNEKGRDTYIYMSLPQWTRATYMLYERNVITDCLQELLEEQLIDRRSIIMYDQKTFEYKINVTNVQALIKELPEKESKNLPNLDNYLDFKKRNKAERKKGVVEKSHTPKKASEKSMGVVEKSHTVSEKSHTVSEKSTGGYVKNQRNLDSYLDSSLDNNLDCSNVATACADAASISHTISLLVKNDAKEKPTLTPTTEQPVTPPTKKEIAPRRSVGTKKNKSSKKNGTADLLTLSEIPAPQKPDPATHPYNVELFMKLADYYRGCELAESPNPNSRYQKALKAAMAFVQRKTPFEHVDKLFCFMTGRGSEIGLPELIDKRWIEGGYNTDLWTVEGNFTNKWLECQRMEQLLRGIAPKAVQTKSAGSSMSHDEAQEVAQDAIEKGKTHGYDIKAQAVCEQGVWLVRIDWDGDPLTMRSQAEWDKTFNYNYDCDQQELMKGAK